MWATQPLEQLFLPLQATARHVKAVAVVQPEAFQPGGVPKAGRCDPDSEARPSRRRELPLCANIAGAEGQADEKGRSIPWRSPRARRIDFRPALRKRIWRRRRCFMPWRLRQGSPTPSRRGQPPLGRRSALPLCLRNSKSDFELKQRLRVQWRYTQPEHGTLPPEREAHLEDASS